MNDFNHADCKSNWLDTLTLERSLHTHTHTQKKMFDWWIDFGIYIFFTQKFAILGTNRIGCSNQDETERERERRILAPVKVHIHILRLSVSGHLFVCVGIREGNHHTPAVECVYNVERKYLQARLIRTEFQEKCWTFCPDNLTHTPPRFINNLIVCSQKSPVSLIIVAPTFNPHSP